MAQGEPTVRFARELGMSRQQRYTLRQRVQTHRNHTAPAEVMPGTTLEADALYQALPLALRGPRVVPEAGKLLRERHHRLPLCRTEAGLILLVLLLGGFTRLR